MPLNHAEREDVISAATIPKMIAIDTLAEQLDVSHWTIRTWIREGILSSSKIGRRVLIPVADVQALLAHTHRAARRSSEVP
jgi:excisionase family DNA binding protein